MFRQRQGQTLGADPRPQLAPPQYRLDLNCWNDSNHIAEPQFAYAGAQLGVGTVARIVQHDTARYAGRISSAQLVERNLRLGLEFDLLGNTRSCGARHPRPIPSADTADRRSAGWHVHWQWIASLRLGSWPACPVARNPDVSPPPSARPVWGSPCHQ